MVELDDVMENMPNAKWLELEHGFCVECVHKYQAADENECGQCICAYFKTGKPVNYQKGPPIEE